MDLLSIWGLLILGAAIGVAIEKYFQANKK